MTGPRMVGPPRGSALRRMRDLGAAFLTHPLFVFTILSLVMTYPLVLHLATAIPGPPGDNFEYLYKVYWFEQALLQEGRSPFFIPDVFHPFGYEVALSETTLSNILPVLPVTALFGEVVGYNVAIILSFVLSGCGMYLLVRDLSGSRGAGMLSGCVYAFSSYRMAHLGAGHLPLMGTQWLPLMLWAAERWIRDGRRRDAAMAGLFYALGALSSWYYAYMYGFVVLAYVLLRARPWRREWCRRQRLAGAGLFLAVSIALVLPAAWPLLRLSAEGETAHASLSLAYVDQWSASPLDFVVPGAMHPIWGRAIMARFPQNVHENLLYVGLVPLALVVLGWRLEESGSVKRAYLWLGVLSWVLALGTTLHLGSTPVYLSVSEPLADLFHRAMYVLTGRLALNKVSYYSMVRSGAIPVPLPGILVYLFLPFANAMRVWARFGLVTTLSVAVMSGMGAARWVRSRVGKKDGACGTRRGLCYSLLMLLVLFDLAVLPYAFGYSVVKDQPVDVWLSAQGDAGAVIQYPLDRSWFGEQLYRGITHGRAMAYGYGTFLPRAFQEADDVLRSFPDAESLALLRSWGVRYALVGSEWYGDEWPEMKDGLDRSDGLRYVTAMSDEAIYFGDRLLRQVPSSVLVPPTELVAGRTQKAYLVDRIHVYEIVD
jgi:hypothetical protein